MEKKPKENMMKKTIRTLIILCLSVMFCTFFLTSCEHKHNFKDWKTTKQVTCTEDGEQIGTCKCGETETRKIAATGHVPGAEATCVTPQNCTVCKRELAPARGHHYDNVEVKAPTCTEKGYTIYSCFCGKSRTDKYVDALGHTPDQANSCTQAQYCTTCGKELQAVLGHRVWTNVVFGDPIENYTARNDVTYPFSLQDGILISTNHENSTSSSYTLTAIRDFTLEIEYKVSSELNYDIFKIYHNGDQLANISGTYDWRGLSIDLEAGDTVTFTYSKDSSSFNGNDCAYVKLLTAATVTEEMQLVRATAEILADMPACEEGIYCYVCDELLKETTGHHYEDSVTAPTCTEVGYTTHTCACGDSYVDSHTPMVSHTHADNIVCGVPAACTVCGTVMNDEDGHIPGRAATCTEAQVCDACGEVLTPALGHGILFVEDNYTETNDATYPFTWEDGILVSTNHENSTSSSYTLTALRNFTLNLEYKISSESGYDYLTIHHNYRQLQKISGSYDWRSLSIALQAGDTVTFTYSKDGSSYNGSDSAYVKFLTEKTAVEWISISTTGERFPVCQGDIVCDSCGLLLLEKIDHHQVLGEVELPEAIEYYRVVNDTRYPFTLNNGILVSTNHGDSTSSSYTLTALRNFTLELEYKVSSETNYDIMKIYHNGDQLASISGSYDWRGLSIDLEAGDTVTFTYSKDVSYSEGNDCAYVKLLTEATVTTEIGLVDATEDVLASMQTDETVRCVLCGEVLMTKGLSYTSNGDGTYTVAGMGTCTDTEIVIPSMHNGGRVTKIGEYAFGDCENLTRITLPETIATVYSSTFYMCPSLTEIIVDGNNAYYTSVDGVLFNKAKTELICYPAAKTATRYTVPNGVTHIGECAFYNCTALESVELPDSVTSIGDSAFSGSSLEDIELPDSVTSIGTDAFLNCLSLKSVKLSGGLTSIEDTAFAFCKSLTSIVIPDGVTHIGEYAFYNCNSLKSVELSDSVTSIAYGAFATCLDLENILFGGTMAQWQAITFGNDWDYGNGNYTVTCTDGTLAS